MDEGTESPIRGSGLQDRRLVRIGDTVRRPSGPFTRSVQDLLRHLRNHGFDIAPEPLGIDAAGREVLSFIEGLDQGWPLLPGILRDEGAERLGALASRLRSVLESYQCPATARWQFARGAPGPGEAMQHGDLGPWNLLWAEDGQLAGVLDWDFAQPGDPWYDTGYLAWFIVPLMDDNRAQARGFPAPPDRLRRLDAFAAGAAMTRVQLLEATLAAQADYERRVISRRPASRSCAEFYQRGFHKNTARDRRWAVAHFGHFLEGGVR